DERQGAVGAGKRPRGVCPRACSARAAARCLSRRPAAAGRAPTATAAPLRPLRALRSFRPAPPPARRRFIDTAGVNQSGGSDVSEAYTRVLPAGLRHVRGSVSLLRGSNRTAFAARGG